MNQAFGTMTWDAKGKYWKSKVFVRTYTNTSRKDKLHAEGQFHNLRSGLDFFKQYELDFPLIYLEGPSLEASPDWKNTLIMGKDKYPFVDFIRYNRNTKISK
jgi:hypothetical protein